MCGYKPHCLCSHFLLIQIASRFLLVINWVEGWLALTTHGHHLWTTVGKFAAVVAGDFTVGRSHFHFGVTPASLEIGPRDRVDQQLGIGVLWRFDHMINIPTFCN